MLVQVVRDGMPLMFMWAPLMKDGGVPCGQLTVLELPASLQWGYCMRSTSPEMFEPSFALTATKKAHELQATNQLGECQTPQQTVLNFGAIPSTCLPALWTDRDR